MGRVGLINSGGESHGSTDLADAVYTAVVNKRAGGMGLICGRKAFQRPMTEGIELINTIQDVYLDKEITIAWINLVVIYQIKRMREEIIASFSL